MILRNGGTTVVCDNADDDTLTLARAMIIIVLLRWRTFMVEMSLFVVVLTGEDGDVYVANYFNIIYWSLPQSPTLPISATDAAAAVATTATAATTAAAATITITAAVAAASTTVLMPVDLLLMSVGQEQVKASVFVRHNSHQPQLPVWVTRLLLLHQR